MVKNSCYECEHKEFGINYTNCKRKCSYKYKMQKLRSDKNVEELVGIIYKRVSKSLRDWVAENYQTSKQMKDNQQTCEALYDMASDIQRELIKYSSRMDFLNLDLVGSYKESEEQ